MLPFLLAINIFMTESFVLTTLIDITETGVIRGNSKERDQQRNWETVLQVLSLRTQPIILEGPIKIDSIDFKKHLGLTKTYGEFYHDFPFPQTMWAVKFCSEQAGIYNVEQLYEDFDKVPVIMGLDETVRFMLPMFNSYGSLKNIHLFTANELNIN